MNTFFTEASLTVLYILCESKVPLTKEQISNILAESSKFTYMDAVIGIENLIDNEYVSKEERINGGAFLPTIEGRITLNRLSTSIRGSVRKKISQYLKENLHALTLGSNVFASVTVSDSGRTDVFLKSFDKDMQTIDIYLTASDSKEANCIAENWQKHADEAIAKLYEVLLQDK